MAMLQPGGEIAESYPGYEYRDQQVEMMQAVGSAFNLGSELLVRGNVELTIENRVARAVLIDVRRAMPNPLAGDKNGHF